MDSRLIFEKSRYLSEKVRWIFQSKDSEWMYLNYRSKTFSEDLEKILNHFKQDELLNVAFSKSDSFETYSRNLDDLPFTTTNIMIWNHNFMQVIEFNQNGIFRLGEI